MPTVFITGANRGLGLEFSRQYSSEGWEVIASCREPNLTHELKSIQGNIKICQMDINDLTQIKKVSLEYHNYPIDILINNAAEHGPNDSTATFGNLNTAEWLNVFLSNSISPLKVTEAFFENIKMSSQKKIVFISSRAGSVSERGKLPHHRRGGSYIYRSSKAALNAATQSLAFDLESQEICVIVLHPGFVQTGMSEDDAKLDASISIAGIRKIISESTRKDNSLFRTYEGEPISW
jgi:NAD(P)-dependent dehydrogenase (short-subunit alcohol dehydrogenase family)